ncbi:MAG TPA: hypothetical protein VGP80_04955 [Gemmatimonadales bacterium]|nr:hypothetical protein [Gemmatimonadales bacterium]
MPALALLWATSLPAQVTARPSTAAWQSDLRLLAREMPARHPGAFATISRAQWDSAVASLARRMPGLNQNERIVEIFRLVALVGDAHTAVQPTPPLRMRYYPLELYQFEDGLFIRRADSAHRALVGARVMKIGRLSPEQALAKVGGIISHENEWWVRSLGPFWLMVPEVLDGLHIAEDPERLPVVLELGGRTETVIVTPAGFLGHGNNEAFDTSQWVSMRTTSPPLYEQRPGEMFWWTLLPDNRTLYISQRGVVPGPRSANNRAQWDQVFALADSARVDKLIIDIRDNGGGNGGLNRYPIQQILRRPTIDQAGHLFVITGRRTFSAAQQFANLLEAWTQATFVGEPTGQKPSQYGDHRPLLLPGTQVLVQISSIYHQAPNEFDQRLFVPPSLYTPLTSADYADGKDPALAAILNPQTESPMALVEAAVVRNDSLEAERTLRNAQSETINRFNSLESQVNSLGYRFLGAGDVAKAVLTLRLNTIVYPNSANTFDSLGEALLAAGRRDEAIAAYRHAMEVEPGFPPSAQALERLGVK